MPGCRVLLVCCSRMEPAVVSPPSPTRTEELDYSPSPRIHAYAATTAGCPTSTVCFSRCPFLHPAPASQYKRNYYAAGSFHHGRPLVGRVLHHCLHHQHHFDVQQVEAAAAAAAAAATRPHLTLFRSIWSKMLSHEIIGYYAWFWGDFFFKIDKTLKFDGIFEVFPHPMYSLLLLLLLTPQPNMLTRSRGIPSATRGCMERP